MYSLKEYVQFAREIYSARGPYGVYKEGTAYLYESVLRQLSPVLNNDPDYVMDKDWDVLLILDACRVDALEEVADEYDFLPDPPFDTIWSAGSYSEGWLRENFTGKQSVKHRTRMQNLVHISGNPFTRAVFDTDAEVNTGEDSEKFQVLDEAWKYGWDADNGYMPPDVLTDRAISQYREQNPDQMLVHYMQPHAPFLSDDDTGYHIDIDNFANPKGTVQQQTPWELARDGVISDDELWDAYIDTLRVGLDSVATLLESIDAEKVVISADHGNSTGEMGIYGHPRGLPLKSLRRVPWVETTAKDTGEYNPSEQVLSDETDDDVNDRLKALGYK